MLGTFFARAKNIAVAYSDRGNRDAAVVQHEMTMPDHLPGRRNRRREAGAEDEIVQAALEEFYDVLAGGALAPLGA